MIQGSCRLLTTLPAEAAIHSMMRLYLARFGAHFDNIYSEHSEDAFEYSAWYRTIEDPEAGLVVTVRIVVDRAVPGIAQYFSSLDALFMTKVRPPFLIRAKITQAQDVDLDQMKRAHWERIDADPELFIHDEVPAFAVPAS